MSPEPQWAKFCAKEPANGREACATMRDFSTSADQPPMVSINLFEVAGEEKRKLRFLIAPIGMLLRPGFRVIIDNKGEPLDGKYDMCFPNACSAEVEIGPKTLAELKKGQNMSVVLRVPGGDVSGRELTFNLPLKDLGTAFDGKPTDPKVLEQQRQALQQQLQKKAEEQRKMLEQQQNGAAPAPAPPPGARACSGGARRSGQEINRVPRASRGFGRRGGRLQLRRVPRADAIPAVVGPLEELRSLAGAGPARPIRPRPDSARKHRRRTGCPRSPRRGDRTAAPWPGAPRRGSTPPFLGVGEHRIDVEDHPAKRVDPVFDDLADREFGRAAPHRLEAPLPVVGQL